MYTHCSGRGIISDNSTQRDSRVGAETIHTQSRVRLYYYRLIDFETPLNNNRHPAQGCPLLTRLPRGSVLSDDTAASRAFFRSFFRQFDPSMYVLASPYNTNNAYSKVVRYIHVCACGPHIC